MILIYCKSGCTDDPVSYAFLIEMIEKLRSEDSIDDNSFGYPKNTFNIASATTNITSMGATVPVSFDPSSAPKSQVKQSMSVNSLLN